MLMDCPLTFEYWPKILPIFFVSSKESLKKIMKSLANEKLRNLSKSTKKFYFSSIRFISFGKLQTNDIVSISTNSLQPNTKQCHCPETKFQSQSKGSPSKPIQQSITFHFSAASKCIWKSTFKRKNKVNTDAQVSNKLQTRFPKISIKPICNINHHAPRLSCVHQYQKHKSIVTRPSQIKL